MRFIFKTDYDQDIRILKHSGYWWSYGVLLAVMVAAPYLLGSYLQSQLVFVFIYAIVGVALMILTGFTGQASLGHAAFFGVGAYAAGLMDKHGMGDPLLGLGVAAFAAAVIGWLTSFLLLRGSDLTRLMVTLGIALMLFELANRMAPITGGADGLQGMMVGPVLGLFSFDLFGKTAYLYVLLVLFIMLMPTGIYGLYTKLRGRFAPSDVIPATSVLPK